MAIANAISTTQPYQLELLPASTARIMKYPHIEALLPKDPGEQDGTSNGG
jgi:hypothetical protein